MYQIDLLKISSQPPQIYTYSCFLLTRLGIHHHHIQLLHAPRAPRKKHTSHVYQQFAYLHASNAATSTHRFTSYARAHASAIKLTPYSILTFHGRAILMRCLAISSRSQYAFFTPVQSPQRTYPTSYVFLRLCLSTPGPRLQNWRSGWRSFGARSGRGVRNELGTSRVG
jgi:hypothetical protein